MAKHARRFPKFATWMAGLYLVWSLLVYFGTLGGEGHDWWPIWLYFVIWPLSFLIDCVMGSLYIILGTAWIWFLGWLISVGATRVFARSGTARK
jgi:hypothetical protein